MISIGSSVGNYRVVSKLGAGAMATVFLAEHPRINKKVAIKVINQDLAASKEMVSRFMTEARAASQIGHDHVVDILDFGQSPEGENFMIMEYLEGQTISSRIRAAGQLDVMTTLHIVMQIVDALQAAHARGVIHRDLKPDNIYLIRRAGTGDYVKILDFGLAKLLSGTEGQNHKTSSGSVLGTPHYMAPEQCEGKTTIDGRADLYSVGCIMYQMLTGELPFPGEGFAEVLIKHLSEPPPLLRARVPQCPASVEKLILHCLAKSRDHRFQTAEELAWAIHDPESWSLQFGDDLLRIVGPLPGRAMAMLPPQMPTMHTNGVPPVLTAAAQPISPVSTVNLPPPVSSPAGLGAVASPSSAGAVSAAHPVLPNAAATLAPTALPPSGLAAQPGQSAVRPSLPVVMPPSALDIPVVAGESAQVAELPSDASRAAPQMATLISDLSSASLSALLRPPGSQPSPAANASRPPSIPPSGPSAPSSDGLVPEELAPSDVTPAAGLSAQHKPAGAASQPGIVPGPASGLHPAALPPPSPASTPNASPSPLDRLKALPPVQRILALPDKQRTMVLGGIGGGLALLMIILAIVIALPGSVRIEISSIPPAAEVVRDGKVLGKTPLQLKLSQGEKARLVLRKEGFEEVERVVSASNQTALSVELSAETTTPQPDKPATDHTKPVETTKPVEAPKSDPSKAQTKVPAKNVKKGPKKKPAIF